MEEMKATNHAELVQYIKEKIEKDREFASDYLQGFVFDALADITDEWKARNNEPIIPASGPIDEERHNASRELLRFAIERMGEPQSYLEKSLLAMTRGLLTVF